MKPTPPDVASLLDRARSVLKQGPARDSIPFIERALEQVPLDPQAISLHGIALWRTGEKEAGVKELEQASRLAPDDVRIQHNLAFARGESVTGFSIADVHRLAFVEEAGPMWARIGWIIVGLSALIAFGVHVLHPVATYAPVAGAKSALEGIGLRRDGLSVALVFASFVVGMSSLLWVMTDLVDRRGRFFWIVLMLIASFCGCLVCLPHALYLSAGRR